MMQHKLSTAVQQYEKRRRRNTRNRMLGCVAGVLVFCITYAALLPAISQAVPYISEAVQTLLAPIYEYNPSDEYTSYTYSDNDIDVQVLLPADSNVPKDAILRVTPIKETHAEYASLTRKAEQAVNGSLKLAQFYDISFYTEQMEYIPVDDRAKVSINYNDPTMDINSDIVVLHYDENNDNPITLDKATLTEEPYTSEQELTFETDGFSTFAVVQVETGVYNGTIITPVKGDATVDGHNSVTKLVGKTVIITTADQKYALSSYAEVYDNGEDRLKGMEVLGHNDTQVSVNANKHLLWTFEQTGATGTVYLKSEATGEYLQLVRDGVAITTELSADDDYLNKQQIYVLRDGDNSNEVGFCVKVGNDYYYLNKYGGTNDFATWKSNFGSENNQFLLYQWSGEVADQPVQTPVAKEEVVTTILGSKDTVGEKNENTTALDGKVLLISTADEYETGSWYALSSDDANNGTRLGAVSAVREGNYTVTAPADGFEKLEWKFIADKTKGNEGKYFIRSVATGEYLHLSPETGNNLDTVATQAETESYYVIKAPEYDYSWVISRSKTTGDNGHYTDGRELSYASPEKYFQTVNNAGTDDFNGDEKARYRACLILSEAASVATTKVADPTAENLNGRVFAINNVYGDVTRSALSANYGDRLLTSTAIVNGNTYTVSPDALWKFEDADADDTYYIRIFDYQSGASGKYLQLTDGGIENIKLVDSVDNATKIYLDNDGTTTGYINLHVNNANGRYLAYNSTEDLFACYGSADDRNNFILSEYAVQYQDAPESSVVRATDVAGKVAFIVGVNNNNAGSNDAPVMASTPGTDTEKHLTGENRAINVAQGTTITGYDTNKNLGWYFEATDEPGIYHLVAVTSDGTNKGKYLKIAADGLTMVDVANASDIEVVAADTTNVAADAKHRTTENVVCLRTNINGTYWYVNLNGNNSSKDFTSYSDGGINDRGNHLVIVEIPAVTNVVDKINTLLDQLVATTANGVTTYAFSDAAWIGSAEQGNDNKGQQGDRSDYHDPEFVDDYDQAQAYRREMQLLAREIRTLYAQLPEEDQRYVWRYEIVDSGGKNPNDLEWLWDEVGVVQSNDPLGVKVNVFNYTDEYGNMNTTASGISEKLLNAGFSFYHKIEFDAYTAIVDSDRNNTNKMGNNESKLVMYETLYNGSPSVQGGTGAPEGGLTQEEGSLAYLFGEDSKYRVNTVTMDDGGGLFQKDADGYYYYYCNQNAAWYDPDANEFVLYDTVIRPMYNHGVRPHQVNDVYNFLPFNNPADDLIFDESNTVMDNAVGTDYNQYPYQTNEDGGAYTGVANTHAKTERSGYLNERSDMWFGMTIEFSFLMADNGQITRIDPATNLPMTNADGTVIKDPMIFDFYGDDDVWVYINDKLVLDIGGVHGAERGTINFHTGEVYYQDEGRPDVNTTLAKIFSGYAGVETEGDTLKDGVVYTVKFFYMERGGNVSYCGLKFNMPLAPENMLMIDKERELPAGTENTAGQIIGNPYHTFRVVEANADGKPVDKDGNVTDNLNAMIPYFKENTTFNICTLGGASQVGTGIVDADGYFTIPVDRSAVFEHVLEKRRDDTKVYYAVVEVLYDAEKDQYTKLTYELSTVQPRQEYDATIVKDFSPDGAASMLEKKVVSYTYTSGIDANESVEVNLTNVINPPLGKLAITKKLASGVNGYADEPFTILVEFGGYAIVDDNGTPYYELVYTPVPVGTKYTVTDADGNIVQDTDDTPNVWEVTSSDGTITLKPGQTATFDGIVAGTYYRVSELTKDGWTPTYSATVYTFDDNGNKTENSKDFTGSSANGEIGYNQPVDVTVTNQNFTVHVDVPITKKVEYAAFTDTFTFQVEWINKATTLDQAIAAANGYTYYSSGSITVTPANAVNGAGGKVVIGFSDSAISNMSGDTGVAFYKISEVDTGGNYIYDKTYYIVKVTLSKSGGTDGKGSAEITGVWKSDNLSDSLSVTNALEFTNHRTTSVEINKEVTGGSTADEFKFNYTIKYPDADTEYREGTFTLNHGGIYHIQDVPIGAIVEVREEERPDYFESYNVTAYYEAEYGTLTTVGTEPNINADANASAGRWVGSIKGSDQSAQTITIPLYTHDLIGADFVFRYAQQDSRKFTMQIGNTIYSAPFVSTGGWQAWDETDSINWNTGIPALSAGSTNLIIGGEGTSYAPNLDYLKVVFGRVQGNVAAVNVLGDGDTIHFVNEPCASVTVHKTVEGPVTGKQYSFTASAVDANGNDIELPAGDANFTIGHNETHVIGNLPMGAVVTVTEEATAGVQSTTMKAPIERYEAEEGMLNGSDIAKDQGAGFSGTGFVMNLKRDQTVSFTVTAETAGTYGLRLCYAQNDTRSFGVTVNGVQQVVGPLSNTNAFNFGWTTVDIEVELIQGENTIVVGGVVPTDDSTPNNWAPNLDYIELLRTTTNNSITVTAGADVTLNVINTVASYSLPTTGGVGTQFYTLGGLLLMAAPLLYGYRRKRKWEGGELA